MACCGRWTGIRPPWGKMTGVRPVRLVHDKRAAGWTRSRDRPTFSSSRFDCSEQKYQMARGHCRPAGAHPDAWAARRRPTACTSASPSAPPGAAIAASSAAISTGTASWCSPMWTASASEVAEIRASGRAGRADAVQHLHRRRHPHQPFGRPAAPADGHRAAKL